MTGIASAATAVVIGYWLDFRCRSYLIRWDSLSELPKFPKISAKARRVFADYLARQMSGIPTKPQ